MDRCDVLVVGGGPGGSSCAWGLRESGLDVVVLDRVGFPRDKVCAGWITPQICTELDIDPADYAKERVIQPIRGFSVESSGAPPARAEYGEVVSYGIRRCEFDDFLLRRCAARLRLGESLRALRRDAGRWIANEAISARFLVGAGGHFCPVARHLGARPGTQEPTTIVAREVEFEMVPEQLSRCSVSGEVPELLFEADLRGYGWIVRKGDWLNVGLGRQDDREFPQHVERFLEGLRRAGRVPPGTPRRLPGHAYLLYGESERPLARDGVLLVGDAAGLACGRSGEGIRPAVESGLLAARSLGVARAPADAARAYAAAVVERLGPRHGRKHAGPTDWLPARWRAPAAGRLLASPWFVRNVVVGRWFLHRHVPALAPV